MALFVAALVFLRWLPHYGFWILTLIGITGIIAVSVYATQRDRYYERVRGIAAGRFPPDAAAVLWTSGSVVLLGAIGMIILLVV